MMSDITLVNGTFLMRLSVPVVFRGYDKMAQEA